MPTVQDLVETMEITATCPKCSAQSQQEIRRLRADGHFTCAGCGGSWSMDLTEFDEKVAAVERQISEQINGLPKWVKITR